MKVNHKEFLILETYETKHMGLNINLVINFKGIAPEAWENTWLESLDILQRFPIPLARHSIEQKNGQKRHVYTRKLILDKGSPKECWYLEGDLLSGQFSETFDLYRHLSAYTKASGTEACFEHSVFLTDEPDYADSSNGLRIWDSKTQGHPFHLAVLAVGILLENRFPGKCYVYGDIEDKQIEVVLEWLDKALGKNLQAPICFDAERLFQQLDAIYKKDKKGAIARFSGLYQDDQRALFKAQLQFWGKAKAYHNWAKDLNHYDALNQWGEQDIMRTVLELSGEVEELIAFVEQAVRLRPARKKAFEWTDVLKMLCGDYIFVNPVERETLKHLFEPPKEDMPTIDDVFSRLFLKMAGMPYISPLYVPADELLELFALRDPQRGSEYHDIIQNYQQKLTENTVLADEVVHDLEERLESSSNYQQAEERKAELVEAYAPHEQYIIRQAIQQQDQFGAFDQNISAIAPGLQDLIDKYPEVFNLNSAETYLQKLNKYTFDAGFGISESAWAQIDQTKDIAILKRLLALAAVDNQERSFWRWRKHIFETPELWPQLLMLEEGN